MSKSRSFYGRSLPEILVDFRSDESRSRLIRSLSNGTAFPYLALSSCFNTQAEPAYCGVTTLAITLNALQIDPQRIWKTPWRWYTEDLLDCCRPLEDVKKVGITMEEFQCLAQCNGAICDLVRGSEVDYETFKKTVTRVCTGEFTESKSEEFLCVSYSRRTLEQTGDGHFSPIAAMDTKTNSVLVLDTARFKYPPHWVPMELMFKSLLPLDPATGLSRGYFVLRAKNILKDQDGHRVCCVMNESDVENVELPVPAPVYKSTQCSGRSCSS